MTSFEELGVDPELIKGIKELGFESPMPIQEQVIEYLLREEHGDVLALAQTGTGKTAAFGLPLLQQTDSKKNNVQHLILSPTRELCLQIADDIRGYAKYKDGLKVVPVFGGASIENQIRAIKRGAHIISATPGRLLDLMNRNVIDLKKIKSVVLDEADEMLNMGFKEELELILKETPKEKYTFLFSATMPKEISKIASRYMNKPFEITVGSKNSSSDLIEHVCYTVHAKDRYAALKRIADYYPEIYGIVFCRTRAETQEIADKLIQDGYNADAIHGDLSQAQRDAVMNKFRIQHLTLLVATDVAARGIDVDNLTHIINYNLPDENDLYTHRSGRTGRAGRRGTSIVITNLKEKYKVQQIERQINKKFTHLPVPSGKEICEKQLFYLVDKIEKIEVDTSQIDPYLTAILSKLEWLDREELIKKFVSVEFNRFLEYYKNATDLNAPDDSRSSSKHRSGGEGYTRFFINLGKTDNLNPATLIGLINDYTNKRNIEIGDIEILKNFSFFETDSNFAELVLNSFQNKTYKKRKVAVEVAAAKKRGGTREKKGRTNSRNFSDSKFSKSRKKYTKRK